MNSESAAFLTAAGASDIGGSDDPFTISRPGGEAEECLPLILILATNGEARGRVHERLEEEFEVELVKTFEEATTRLQQQRFALILLDWREGGRPVDELAACLRTYDAEMSVMVLGAGRAVKVIAEQCLQVPFDSQDLVALMHHEVQVAMRRRGRSTAIREMEEVIGLLRRELEVKDSMAGYGEASASMVHDLQNALCSTLGYTARLIHETAQLKDVVGDQAKPIDTIAKKLEHTSNYLLHLAQTCRYRDGNVMGHERLDLQAEIEQVRAVLFFNSPHLQVFAPRVGEAGSRAEGTAVAVVRGDRYELHRVFQNLFKNAFEAAADEVRVTLSVRDRQVRVEVADDGRGFAEGEETTALFQAPRSSKRGGQGLGLRICHQIIRRHGGDITVRSEPGRGAVVTVMLPLYADV